MRNIKIVADSSADLRGLDGVPFACAPLKIITAQKEYVDDEKLDVPTMVSELKAYRGKSSTACPNTHDWLDAFGDAQEVYCVAITSALSGSYNSACQAKQEYEQTHPDRRVLVIDSLSAGPEEILIVEKLQEMLLADKSFDEICAEISAYQEKASIVIMLESMQNLANNGRISPLAAKAAGVLGIRSVVIFDEEGRLQATEKCRGEKRALDAMVARLKALGFSGRKARITHVCNERAAETLKAAVLEQYPQADVQISPSRGLVGYYAEKGGVLLGFEAL